MEHPSTEHTPKTATPEDTSDKMWVEPAISSVSVLETQNSTTSGASDGATSFS